jgi:hypothetical protein
MKNVTVTVSDEHYTRARIWSAQHNMSISATVRIIIEAMPTWNGPKFRQHLTERERTLALRKAAKSAGVQLNPGVTEKAPR